MRRSQVFSYVGVILLCFAAGMIAGWLPLAARIDHYVYDLTIGNEVPSSWTPASVVVKVDEATLTARHGMRNIRPILTEALQKISAAGPRAVAIDVILHDDVDEQEDARLAEALRNTPNLILPCEIVGDAWEDPAPRFKPLATALGHVHPEQDRFDGVSRQISLEAMAGQQRRWALSLEAFRIAQGTEIVESPQDLVIGDTVIPATRQTGARPLLIRYLPAGAIPTISVLDLDSKAGQLRGKTVFLGITALTAAKDRLVNPRGENVPGVEVHAHVFETLRQGRFLRPPSDLAVLLACFGFAAAVGLTFTFIQGSFAYVLVLALIALAHWLPVQLLRQGIVFPYFAPVAVAWLSSAGAATYLYFFVRRELRRTESEKSRYQQAIHWAAHEMRTPLTAIQGSSEIMAKYANLPEAKRHQLSEMINSESKRLSRIITTFLDIERISEGQVELKQEPFTAAEIVQSCVLRATPLADRKNIRIFVDSDVAGDLLGDRELMEYALYNLITNAVKYSPAETEIHISSELQDGLLRLAVQDQGIGMDAKELKNIFQKFYRTKKAEASGEVGTGIGLSIVEQIVVRHGGRIDVSSVPGRGSCFTMVLRTQSPHDAQVVSR